MRIGIYSPNWVGDAVMSLPFINHCHRRFPKDELVVVAKSWVSSIFLNHPFVYEIEDLEPGGLKGIKSTTRTGLNLKKLGLDVFYLLSDSLRSAWLAWLSGTGQRVGFRGQGRSPLLTQVVEHSPGPPHRSLEYLRLLQSGDSQGWSNLRYDDLAGIQVSESEHEWARKEMKSLELTRPVAVFPWSVAESRRVPLDNWESILVKGLEKGYQLLFFGDSAAREVSDILVEKFGHGRVKSVCGHYSLRQSVALLSQCEGAIGADTGMGHVAANLGLKIVSLFGAGDPSRTAPLGPRTIVITENVYCSPCQENVCANSEEPLICLKSIDASKVWESYLSL